ncbi:DUF5684 domain-containing protein [Pedobacter sp. AW31-3R]|uniref:DUF5684 domain-containing protein n=1 Tax=Pedobacter sp. AW31-3R TaxID=3445781 RepID=UPI003FA10C13
MDYNSSAYSPFAAIGVFGASTSFVLLVLTVVGLWKMFEKAGKPGWAAIIPVYNLIVLLEITGKPMIWIIWLIIPCTSPIFAIWLVNLNMKSFGKSVAYTIGAIFLPFIIYPIIGLGDSVYLGPSAAEAKKGFGANNGFGSNNPFNQPPTTPNV